MDDIPMFQTKGFGELAGALAKAQAAFPAIPRDKEVVVKTKTGGEYRFKYAPLDSIISAVRKPLSDNGLAIVQLLDDGDLVTMLLHSAGARLSGSVALPTDVDIQGLGSAITYLRRYSIQAILGIATEEDDDGNRAAGNIATPRRPPASVIADVAQASPFQSSEQGIVEFAKTGPADGELRSGPTGPFLVFRLSGKEVVIPQVAAYGPLAETLNTLRRASDFLAGVEVIASGVIDRVPFPQSNRTFQRMTLARIEKLGADGWTLPAPASVLPAEKPAEGLSKEDLEDLEELPVPWPDVVKADPA